MSCINVEEAPQLHPGSARFVGVVMELTVRCWSPREPWPPSPCSSSQLSHYFSPWHHRHEGRAQTILNFANAGLEIIERQIGHGLFEAGEIHSGDRAGRLAPGKAKKEICLEADGVGIVPNFYLWPLALMP